ncbi:transposase [Streptomyces sp. NPDC096354]|uniref:transposase n=1 Tax=Streptomyces sp. NPDC096354 TaxID=3366088 RepID=UPI003808F203
MDDLRAIVKAILYVNRTGIPREYLPYDFPPYKTVYDYYAKWEVDGTTQQVHDLLRDKARRAQGRSAAPSATVIRRLRRGRAMVRYVHSQLMTCVEVACAMAIVTPVVSGVRGVPKFSSDQWPVLLSFLGAIALFGALACTPLRWLGGRQRDFETAVPLANPEAVLPTPKEALRRSFDGGFVVVVVVPSLVVGLMWPPFAFFWPLVFVPDRAIKGIYVAHWERRHGVLLWHGHVKEQPLGKDQLFYSSARVPTPE